VRTPLLLRLRHEVSKGRRSAVYNRANESCYYSKIRRPSAMPSRGIGRRVRTGGISSIFRNEYQSVRRLGGKGPCSDRSAMIAR